MSSETPRGRWVAGADGCRAGWLVVFRSLDGESPHARIVPLVEEIMSSPEHPLIVAIDMPIGLPKVSIQGGCAAEREARKALGRDRGPSVFPRPSRSTLRARKFEEACEIERKNSQPRKKITKQVFNLLCKLREVDAVAPRYSGRIFECHPEVSFWVMNNRSAMRCRKKRRCGFDERCNHLTKHGYKQEFLTCRLGSTEEHGRDDLLDACAAAWTAERIWTDNACKFPTISDPIDDAGLEMAIWA